MASSWSFVHHHGAGERACKGSGAQGASLGMAITEDDVPPPRSRCPRRPRSRPTGHPGFRVKDKLFARIREEGDVLVVWCSDLGEKEALIESEPDKFFTTPHYDGHPTVLVRFGAVDLDELAELLTESWRMRAPKRLLAEFDASLEP